MPRWNTTRLSDKSKNILKQLRFCCSFVAYGKAFRGLVEFHQVPRHAKGNTKSIRRPGAGCDTSNPINKSQTDSNRFVGSSYCCLWRMARTRYKHKAAENLPCLSNLKHLQTGTVCISQFSPSAVDSLNLCFFNVVCFFIPKNGR